MSRYAMSVDTRKCVSCGACVLACKHENNVPDGYARDWVVTKVAGKHPNLTMENYSERCHHCSDAPCVASCPTGASHYIEGGIVKVDSSKCTGCKACIQSCPYDARYVHVDGYVDKCTFCDHRVKEGLNPACATVCPTDCLTFGDIENQESDIFKKVTSNNTKRLKETAGTKPNLIFITRGAK